MGKDLCKLYRLPPNPGSILHFISVLSEAVAAARVFYENDEVVVVAEYSDMVACVKVMIDMMPIGTSFRIMKRMFWEKKLVGVSLGKPDLKFFGART
jgi:hypothetical protein